jgi:cytochrome c biogenesis protein
VFQVTKSPGKNVVYLGCLFLVLGVFSMFYIRERRLWVWIKDGGEGAGAHALMAMSTQRKTLDFDKEFAELKEKLPQSA